MVKSTVIGIITKKDNSVEHVLLVRRNSEPYKGYWSLPGGHIEANEPVESAIKREVKEETGLKITPYFLFYFDEIIPEKKIHAVVCVFTGEWIGEISFHENEIQEAKWFPLSEALSQDLAFHHKNVINKYLMHINTETKYNK